MADNVYIVASRRTPIGAFQGAFASVAAPALGSRPFARR
jgi:acetyl-CoA acetyltransferase